jgi:hypothetical protein
MCEDENVQEEEDEEQPSITLRDLLFTESLSISTLMWYRGECNE